MLNPLFFLSVCSDRTHLKPATTGRNTYRVIVILALAGVALGGATSSVAVAHVETETPLGDQRQSVSIGVFRLLVSLSLSLSALSPERAASLSIRVMWKTAQMGSRRRAQNQSLLDEEAQRGARESWFVCERGGRETDSLSPSLSLSRRQLHLDRSLSLSFPFFSTNGFRFPNLQEYHFTKGENTEKRPKPLSRTKSRGRTEQPSREECGRRRRRKPRQAPVPLGHDPVPQPLALCLDLGPGGRRRRPGGSDRRRRRRGRRRDDRSVDWRGRSLPAASSSAAAAAVPSSFHSFEGQSRQLQHETHAQGAEDHDGKRQVRGRGQRLREDEAAEGVDGAADVDDGVD